MVQNQIGMLPDLVRHPPTPPPPLSAYFVLVVAFYIPPLIFNQFY